MKLQVFLYIRAQPSFCCASSGRKLQPLALLSSLLIPFWLIFWLFMLSYYFLMSVEKKKVFVILLRHCLHSWCKHTRVTRCHFAKNDGSFLRAVSSCEAEACAIVSKVLVELLACRATMSECFVLLCCLFSPPPISHAKGNRRHTTSTFAVVRAQGRPCSCNIGNNSVCDMNWATRVPSALSYSLHSALARIFSTH